MLFVTVMVKKRDEIKKKKNEKKGKEKHLHEICLSESIIFFFVMKVLQFSTFTSELVPMIEKKK